MIPLALIQETLVESTAEGQEGEFYEMVKSARARDEQGVKPGEMDFKFFFFGSLITRPSSSPTFLTQAIHNLLSQPKTLNKIFGMCRQRPHL